MHIWPPWRALAWLSFLNFAALSAHLHPSLCLTPLLPFTRQHGLHSCTLRPAPPDPHAHHSPCIGTAQRRLLAACPYARSLPTLLRASALHPLLSPPGLNLLSSPCPCTLHSLCPLRRMPLRTLHRIAQPNYLAPPSTSTIQSHLSLPPRSPFAAAHLSNPACHSATAPAAPSTACRCWRCSLHNFTLAWCGHLCRLASKHCHYVPLF